MDDNLPFGDPSDFDSLFSNGDQIGGSLFDTDSLIPDVFSLSPWSPVTTTVSSASPDLLETMVSCSASSAGSLAMSETVSANALGGGVMKIPIPQVSSIEKSAERPQNQMLQAANWMQNSGGNIIHVSDVLEQQQQLGGGSTTREDALGSVKVHQYLEEKVANQTGLVERLPPMTGNQANLLKFTASDLPKSNSSVSIATSSAPSQAAVPVQLKHTVIQPAILHQLQSNTQLQRLLIQGNSSGINIPTLQTIQPGQQTVQLVSVQQQPAQSQATQGAVHQMTLNTHGGPVAVNTQGGHLVIQRPTQAGLQALQVHQASSQPPQPTVNQLQAVQINASNAGSHLQGIQVSNSPTTAPNILLRTLPGSVAAAMTSESPVVVTQNKALHLLQGGQFLAGSNLSSISVQAQGGRSSLDGGVLQGQLVSSENQQQVVATHSLTTDSMLHHAGATVVTVSQSGVQQPQQHHSISGLQGLNIGNGMNNVNIVASEAQVFNNIMLGTTTQSGQSSQISTGEHTGLTVKIGDQIVNLQGIQNTAQLNQRLLQQRRNLERVGGAGVGVSESTSSNIGSSPSNPVVLGLPNVVKVDPVTSQQAHLVYTQSAAKPTNQTFYSVAGQPAVQLTQLQGRMPQQLQPQPQQQPQQPQQQQQQQLIQVNVGGGKVLYLTPQQVQLLQQKAKQQQQQQLQLQQRASQSQPIASVHHQTQQQQQQQQAIDSSPRQQAQQQQQNYHAAVSQLQQIQPKASITSSLSRAPQHQQQQAHSPRSVAAQSGSGGGGMLVVGGTVVGGKHPIASSMEGQVTTTGATTTGHTAKKRARGKQNRSQSTASELSQLSPASVKSYHSPASVQSIPPPESPGSSSMQQHHPPPASPAGSMGPPSNLQVYLPPSPAGSVGQRSMVHSLPPPSPANTSNLGPPSNLQGTMPPSPAGSIGSLSQLPPSPVNMSNVLPGSSLKYHMIPQSPQQSNSQQPVRSPGVQSLLPPSSLSQLNQQLAAISNSSNKEFSQRAAGIHHTSNNSTNNHQISSSQISPSSGYLPLNHLLQTAAGSTTDKSGVVDLGGLTSHEQEGALPPDLEQIDLFSPTGENLDIFDSNNDLLDTVGKDLLGVDEQDDVVATLSTLSADPSAVSLRTAADGGSGSTSNIYTRTSANNSKASSPGNKVPDASSAQDDVLQYYVKQLKEQSSSTKEALQQSLQAILQQKEVMARQQQQQSSSKDSATTIITTPQGGQQGRTSTKIIQQEQQQTAMSKLGALSAGQRSHVTTSEAASVGGGGGGGNPRQQEMSLAAQEARLKYVQILTQRQKELQARHQHSGATTATTTVIGSSPTTATLSGDNLLLTNLRATQALTSGVSGNLRAAQALTSGVLGTEGGGIVGHANFTRQQTPTGVLVQQGTGGQLSSLSAVSGQQQNLSVQVNSLSTVSGQQQNLGGQLSSLSTVSGQQQNVSGQLSSLSTVVTGQSGDVTHMGGFVTKHTRSLSDTAGQLLVPEHSGQQRDSRSTSLDDLQHQQQHLQGQGSLRKLQQLLETRDGSVGDTSQSGRIGISGAVASSTAASGFNPAGSPQIGRTIPTSSSVNPGHPGTQQQTQVPGGVAATHPTAVSALVSGVRSGGTAAPQPKMSQVQAALAQIQNQASQQGLSQAQVLSALKVALRDGGQQNVLQKLLAHALPSSTSTVMAAAQDNARANNDLVRTEATHHQAMSTALSQSASTTALLQIQSPLGEIPPSPVHQKVAMATQQVMAGGGAGVVGVAAGGGGLAVDGSPIKRTPVVCLNPKHEELLKRIQEHIRILHRTTNRTPQQNDFMKQLIDGEKRILRFGRIEALKLQNAQLKSGMIHQGSNQSQLLTQQLQAHPGVSSSLIGSQCSGTAAVSSSLVNPQSSGMVSTMTTQSITKPLTPTDIVLSGPVGQPSGATAAATALQSIVAQKSSFATNNAQTPPSMQYNSVNTGVHHQGPSTTSQMPETLKGLLSEDEYPAGVGISPSGSAIGSVATVPSPSAIRGRLTGAVRTVRPAGVNVGQTGNLVPSNATQAVAPTGGASAEIGGVSTEMAKQKIEKLMQRLAPPIRQQLVTKLSQMSPQEQQAFYKQHITLMKMQKQQQLKFQKQAQQQQQQQAATPQTRPPHPQHIVQIDRPQPNASLVKQLMQTDPQIDSPDQLDGTSRYSGPRTTVQHSLTASGEHSMSGSGHFKGIHLSTNQIIVGKSSLHSVQLPPSKSSLQMLTRPQLFQLQLKKDQQGALKPDATSGFQNYKDAIKRLIKYHVWQEGEDKAVHVEKAESEYNEYSGRVLDVMDRMLNKYQQLLFNESLRDSPSAEMVMVERMFLSEERHQLEQDRLHAKQHPELFKPTPYIPAAAVTPVVKRESLTESLSDESECGSGGGVTSQEVGGGGGACYRDVKDCKVVLSPLPVTGHYDNVKVKTEKTNDFKVKQEPMDMDQVTLEVKVKTEEAMEEGVPSPSYTVQTSGQGLKMVFKSSPCTSPAPSVVSIAEEEEGQELKPVNHFSDISYSCTSPAPSVSIVEEEGAETGGRLFSDIKSSPAPFVSLDEEEPVNDFSDISDDIEEEESLGVIDSKRPRLDCDNNNLQKVQPKASPVQVPASSSFANQYEEFLRRQSVKEEEVSHRRGSGSSPPLPPFVGYTDTRVHSRSTLSNNTLTHKPDPTCGGGATAGDTLRSLGFDPLPPISSSSSENHLLQMPRVKNSVKYPGCTTLASLLMGSDSDSESQPANSSSLARHHEEEEDEPIEIDLTLSPGVAESRDGGSLGLDCGDKAEMQNAIESILGLEQDWQLPTI